MSAVLGWGDLELLEQIRASGTLGGAARSLGVDQTTASRRLAALERRTGLRLFERVEGRLVPTAPLAAVADRLRTMSELAAVSTAVLNDEKNEMQANVRLTSVGFLLAYALAPSTGAFEREYPSVCLEFVADDRPLSFDRRETDVALRLGPAAEDSTRIRKIGEIEFLLCRPSDKAAASENEMSVVCYGEDLAGTPEMRALEVGRPNSLVAFRSDRLDILMQAALAIGALVMLPAAILRNDPRFEVVSAPRASALRPVYLLVHPDRVSTPSVAAVTAWADGAFRRWNATGGST
jgi:DNA-binding transcriptional LysR family regulator